MVPPPHTVLPPPQAVVCDLDGTLVDTVPTRIEAWLATFADAGLPAERSHVASLIGSDGKWLAEQVAGRAGRTLDMAESERIDRLAGERYDALNTHPRPLPGARAFLAGLDQAAIPWAVATSSRPAQIVVSLAALALDHQPIVIDGLAVARAKPAPDLLEAAAARLAAPPASCWCVGDSRWDVEAATAAGMQPIGVTTGAATADDLRAAGAVAVIDRCDALLGQLVPT